MLADLGDTDREFIFSLREGYALARLPLSIMEQNMVSHVLEKLKGVQDYTGKVKSWFDLLVVRLCKFLRSRNDMGIVRGRFTYLKRVEDRQKLPHELELQMDLFDYLISSFESPLIEVSHIASGRTDIFIALDGFRFVIEVKRSISKTWSCFSVRPHLRQAAAYSTSDIRLGVLATLDLSVREPGDPHVSNCFDVIQRRLSRKDARTVVFMRVPGNRLSPSTLS